MSADLRLLRPAQVAEALSIHRSTLWRWVKRGDFPAPIQLGRNTVAFRESEVRAWIDSRTGDSAA